MPPISKTASAPVKPTSGAAVPSPHEELLKIRQWMLRKGHTPHHYPQSLLDVAVWGTDLKHRVGKELLLEKVGAYAKELGRPPTPEEVSARLELPSPYILIVHFHTWDKTIKLAERQAARKSQHDDSLGLKNIERGRHPKTPEAGIAPRPARTASELKENPRLVKLIERTVEAQKDLPPIKSRYNFVMSLRRLDPLRSALFEDMTRIDGKRRASYAELSTKLGVEQSLLPVWEERLLPVCKTMGWEVKPLPENSGTKLDPENMTIGRVEALIREALASKSKNLPMTKETFVGRLRKIDLAYAAIFENLACRTPSAEEPIRRMENGFLDLSQQMGWTLNNAMATQKLSENFDALAKEARDSIDTRSPMTRNEFARRLRESDPSRAAVFDDLIDDRESLSKQRLADKLHKDDHHVSLWQKELLELFETMHWPVGKARTKMLESARRENETQERTARLVTEVVASKTTDTPITREDFTKSLREIDSRRAVVFENLPHESGKESLRQIALVRQLGTPIRTIERWEREFFDLCNQMKWPLFVPKVSNGIAPIRWLGTRGPRGGMTREFSVVLPFPMFLDASTSLETARTAGRTNEMAAQTLRSGGAFFLGSIGAKVVNAMRTGDWSELKEMSPLGVANEFSALTIGGEAGRLLSTGAVNLIPEMPLPIKGAIARGGALAAALTLVQALKTGEINFKQIPRDIAVCLAASTIVKGATAVLSRSAVMQGAAELMGLTRAGKATFWGAVATSIAEFVLIGEITHAIMTEASRPNVNRVHEYILTLLKADSEIQKALQSGMLINEDDVTQIADRLEELARMLAAAPDVDEQIVELEYIQAVKEAEESLTIAKATGNPDAEWNHMKQLRRLERRRDQRIAAILEDEKNETKDVPINSLAAASEFGQLTNEIAMDLPIDGASRTVDESAEGHPLRTLLDETYHGLSRQLTDYLRYRKERLTLAVTIGSNN